MSGETIDSFKNVVGEKLQPMSQVFYCAKMVRDFTKNLRDAEFDHDHVEEQKWAAALDGMRSELYKAIEALPEGERGTLVAMYETLRHWAYR